MGTSKQALLNQASNAVSSPLLLTISAVAAQLGVSRPTVYKMIYHQGLPSLKLGGCRRVSTASLKRWLQEREQLA